MLQSYGAKATASSSLADRTPELAADENVRTWWSAQSGGTNEWLRLDLGKECRINAVQVNFAEQETHLPATRAVDYHAYRLLASSDGRSWHLLVDQSDSRAPSPHDYAELPQPATARFLELRNLHVPCGGKFAVRDLRVFGHGGGLPPEAVSVVSLERHKDERNATVRWKKVPLAQGYLVRFGISADALYQCIQLQGAETERLTTHVLNRGLNYFWRIDAFNENGFTPGHLFVPEPKERKD